MAGAEQIHRAARVRVRAQPQCVLAPSRLRAALHRLPVDAGFAIFARAGAAPRSAHSFRRGPRLRRRTAQRALAHPGVWPAEVRLAAVSARRAPHESRPGSAQEAGGIRRGAASRTLTVQRRRRHGMYRRTIGVMGRLLDQNDGLGLYGRNLLQEMLKLDPHSRYLIFLNTPQSQHMFDEFPNAQTCVAPARSKLWWDQVLVPLAARRHDVTLLFNPKFSIPLLTGRPCVFVHQGSDWYVNPQNYLWWDNLYIRLMLPLYDRKARLTLSISQATLDDLARLSPIDVSKSVVTYAGVSQNFTPQRDEAAIKQFLADYALPQRFILTVARVIHGGHPGQPFYPGGNNERLLRAWRRYRRAGGELPLVMAGARIEPYLRAKGFTDADLEDVFFPGFIPNARIHMAYQQAECFILATLCESF